MQEKVMELHISREAGYLYFVGSNGQAGKTKMSRGKKGSSEKQYFSHLPVTKEKGYLYFIDKQGDISRAKMQRRHKII